MQLKNSNANTGYIKFKCDDVRTYLFKASLLFEKKRRQLKWNKVKLLSTASISGDCAGGTPLRGHSVSCRIH